MAEKCEYPSGKVLLKSVVFRGFQELDAEEVTTVLFGEKTRQSPQGVTCDFTSEPKSHFTDSTLIYGGRVTFADQKSLGGCWEVDKTCFHNDFLKCNI